MLLYEPFHEPLFVDRADLVQERNGIDRHPAFRCFDENFSWEERLIKLRGNGRYDSNRVAGSPGRPEALRWDASF